MAMLVAKRRRAHEAAKSAPYKLQALRLLQN
jgi:hypothetical protein